MVTPPGLEPGTNSTKNCCATDYTTGYRAKSLAKRVTMSTPRRIENAGLRAGLPRYPWGGPSTSSKNPRIAFQERVSADSS